MRAGAVKRDPIIVGKPAEFMLANIATQFGLHRNQICMVGDRLDTDILFGQQGGLSTMLVLSGAGMACTAQSSHPSAAGWHVINAAHGLGFNMACLQFRF